jgi:hypothetical protein
VTNPKGKSTASDKYLANNPKLRAPRMEHIRNVKPEFFSHESVGELSPLARLAWIGLWTQSDKFGRFPWRPKTLKSRILPFDDVDFSSLLNELLEAGFIQKYPADGNEYGLTVNWEKHQGIGTHEKASKFTYPDPQGPEPDPTDPKGPDSLHSAGTVQALCATRALQVGVGVEVGVEVNVEEGIHAYVQHQQQHTSSPVVAAAVETVTASLLDSKPSGHDKTETPTIQSAFKSALGEYRRIFDKYHGGPQFPFRANQPHEKTAFDFYQEHGQALALAAWEYYLIKDDDGKNLKLPNGREYHSWPIYEFLKPGGDAESCLEIVRPYAGRAQGKTLKFIIEQEPSTTADQISKLDQVFIDWHNSYETVVGGYYRAECDLDEFLVRPNEYIEEDLNRRHPGRAKRIADAKAALSARQ